MGEMSTIKYVMLVDTERCVKCDACVTACRAEWNTPLGYSRNWVSTVEGSDANGMPMLSFLSGRCQHCDQPPCVDACPTGASYKRDDGMVLTDRDLCTGCEFCLYACPYDARFKDPADGMISKCTFCQPRVDAGKQPACVEVCFNGALVFGDINDPDSEVSQRLAQGDWKQLVTRETNTGQNLYYSASTQVDETVLPRTVEQALPAQVLAEGVNPGMKIGLAGMLGTFGAAGLVKLIKRREKVGGDE
jgi:tetrathionate reductase subunit B